MNKSRKDSSIEQLRIPPQSIEAEQAVLGGLMLSPDALDTVSEVLTESAFYRRNHQVIFRALCDMSEKGRPIDVVTVGEWLESQGLSETVDGGAYLIELASTTPSAANIKAYAKIVSDKALLRALIEAGTGIVNDGFQPDGRDAEEVLQLAQQAIGDIGLGKSDAGLKMVSGTARKVWDDLVAESQIVGPRPQSTPFSGVNQILMPFGDEDMVTLAAQTSAGKTTFAMLIAEHYSENRGEHVAVFSLEMSPKQLVKRMAARSAKVESTRLSQPETMTDEEWSRLNRELKKIARMKIAIDDSAGIGLRELRARARRMKKRVGKLGLIVIDYLQLMDTPKRDTREQGIAANTRGIKQLAKELKTPILLLSQLNRSADERSKPLLKDLRESGAIEQDSDTVVFLYHKSRYVNLLIGKQRNGQRNVEATLVPMFQYFDFREFDPTFDIEPELEERTSATEQAAKKTRKPRAQYGRDRAIAEER